MSDKKYVYKNEDTNVQSQRKRRREVRWKGPAGSVFITYEHY
jgi:hypothetical protein